MLIKEYRIPLPLTVEEYRIAQLYMIAVIYRYIFLIFLYFCVLGDLLIKFDFRLSIILSSAVMCVFLKKKACNQLAIFLRARSLVPCFDFGDSIFLWKMGWISSYNFV